MNLLDFKNKEKIRYLEWYDIIIITLILWTVGIISSTRAYIDLIHGETSIAENLVFTTSDNYIIFAMQAVLLLAVLIYLYLRRFDFKIWTIQFKLKDIVYGVFIFIVAALMLDIYFIITGPLESILPFPGPIGGFFANETVSSVIYGALNGVYEELYFLGICLSVRKENLKWVLPFSLVVRTSFHTYQGMISALGIGILFGLFLYFLYTKSKNKNLVPFFVAHALGDVFGVGLFYIVSRIIEV